MQRADNGGGTKLGLGLNVFPNHLLSRCVSLAENDHSLNCNLRERERERRENELEGRHSEKQTEGRAGVEEIRS